MDFVIVPAKVPQNCFKSYSVWGQELEMAEKGKSLECTTKKATSADWTRINSQIKSKGITYSICDEMGVNRKKEKPPEHMYEAMQNRNKKANEPA
jgi:hypothetical protein